MISLILLLGGLPGMMCFSTVPLHVGAVRGAPRFCAKSPLSMGMPGAKVNLDGLNAYEVFVDGSVSKNGKLGKVIYDKILGDQKRMYNRKPMPGFRAGTVPPQVMPRIKFAAIEQLCSQTCEAALEEEGITMLPGQSELSTQNGLQFPGFDGTDEDVPAYCKASGWKPGNDVTFRAFRVRGTKSGGADVEAFPAANTPDRVDLSTSQTLF